MSDFDYTRIDQAYKRISSQVLRTPLIMSEYINNLLEAKVYFKLSWVGFDRLWLRGMTNYSSKLKNAWHPINIMLV